MIFSFETTDEDIFSNTFCQLYRSNDSSDSNGLSFLPKPQFEFEPLPDIHVQDPPKPLPSTPPKEEDESTESLTRSWKIHEQEEDESYNLSSESEHRVARKREPKSDTKKRKDVV